LLPLGKHEEGILWGCSLFSLEPQKRTRDPNGTRTLTPLLKKLNGVFIFVDNASVDYLFFITFACKIWNRRHFLSFSGSPKIKKRKNQYNNKNDY